MPSVRSAVDTNGLHTNVLIDLNGNALPQPSAGANGTITVWRWTWAWDGSNAQIPADVTSWDWLWNGDGGAAASHGTISVSGEPAGSAPVAGSLSWTWAWTRPGNWTWSWAKTLTLDCACAWVWDWNWSWTAEPAQTDLTADSTGPDETPAAAGVPAVSQANTVTAVAVASADATLTETVVQSDTSGTQPLFAGQIVTIVQSAAATANASQRGSANSVGNVGSASQSNRVRVEATAVAVADADQRIEQGNEQGADEAAPASAAGQWAGQQADISQSASAAATGAQAYVVATEPDGSSDVLASASSTAAVSSRQHVDQTNGPGTGDRSQWAGQQVEAAQIAISAAETIQAGGESIRVRIALAVASAQAKAVALQSSDQLAAGDVAGSQVSRQLIEVLQGASASASTAQPVQPHIGPQGDTNASSEARASGAALTEQLSTQLSLEGGDQDATRNVSLLQVADATSQSGGGVAGRASVTNCATAQQSLRQAIGAAAIGSEAADATAFCTPPVAGEPALSAAEPGSSPVGGTAEEPVAEHLWRRRRGRAARPRIRARRTIPGKRAVVTSARQGADPALSAFVPPATRTEDGIASEISTPTIEGPAQTPLDDHERVGKASERASASVGTRLRQGVGICKPGAQRRGRRGRHAVTAPPHSAERSAEMGSAGRQAVGVFLGTVRDARVALRCAS